MSKVSKVIYGDTTVIDITDSTVDANNLLSGNKAYGADGEPVFGALSVGSTINVTTSDSLLFGETLTLSKDSTTLTTTFDNSGEATFTSVLLTGTLTLTCGEYTNTISVPSYDTYNVVFSTVPQGSVVTPTDDIQIWLACAGITDKSYTTLSEVLADRETFETLIADSNACDYMARSTTWAGSSAGIVNSLDAMSLIGKYDYCSNALLGNATWASAICNSTYFESVLNVKVPTMTSNTTPSGEVLFDSGQTPSGSSPSNYYYLFNNVLSDSYIIGVSTSTTWQYFGYDFVNPVKVSKLGVYGYYTSGTIDLKVQAYVGSEWVDVNNIGTYTSSKSWTYYDFTSEYVSSKWRVYCTKGTASSIAFTEFQFYGRTPITAQAIQLNPNMTSATTPYGEVITDATPLSNTQPYYAFDGTILDMFKAELANKYLGYIFETPTVVKRFTINSNQETAGQRWYKAKLQVSTDGTTWTDFDTYTNTEHANVFTVDIDNSTEYLGYRFYFLDDEITGACFINIIAFYGAPINTVIHSARSDTIYTYIDGVQTTLTTTNYSKGIGYCDFSQLEAGTYTLYSTIAKNPSNLSQPYTKDVVITKTPYGNTTEVYFMPDTINTLYWFGYINNNLCEEISTANGWSGNGMSGVPPTYNTNSILLPQTSSGYYVSGIGTKQAISGTLKAIAHGVSGVGGQMGGLVAKTALAGPSPATSFANASDQVITVVLSSKVAIIWSFSTNSGVVSALWYE